MTEVWLGYVQAKTIKKLTEMLLEREKQIRGLLHKVDKLKKRIKELESGDPLEKRIQELEDQVRQLQNKE